jgi:hypothetical protein
LGIRKRALERVDQAARDARRRGEEQPVTPSQLGAAGFALEDLHLVAQDEDLELAVALIALRRQTQDGAQHHIQE